MAVRFDAVICSAGSTGLWRFEPAREYRQILAPERLGRLVEVRLNAEGRLAATYDPSAADLRIWDIQRGAQIGRLACHKPRRVQFLVDGGITAFTSRGLEHWMVECMGDEFRFSSAALVWPNSSQVPAMLLPDGQHVMMVTPDRGVRCIAIPNQTRPLTPYIAGGHALDNLDASPDGKWLFQGMWHGEAARIWNIQSAEPALEFSDLIYPGAVHINGFFTPDGRQLIVSDGRGFTWYEVGTWRKGRRLERAHGSGIAGTVAFAPRANLAALNAEPGRVRLLHADTGEPIATLTTPEELNAKLAFSRDGDTLVGATTERVIQVWNLALLRQRLTELGLNWESPHEVPPVTP